LPKYLCGCAREEKRNYAVFVDHNGNQTTIRRDKQGFEVCPEHGERLWNWKSDRLVYTGKTGIHSSGGKLNTVGTGTEDKRDNRDPQAIGEAIMLAKQSGSNGHHE
jgi:hypothetical protein